MRSLFDELTAKLAEDPRLTKRGGPRVDLSVMLFNARDSVRALWLAAERYGRTRDEAALGELARAVEQLRPIFGERIGACEGRER